jgi:hypothetical protein
MFTFYLAENFAPLTVIPDLIRDPTASSAFQRESGIPDQVRDDGEEEKRPQRSQACAAIPSR